MLHSMTFCRGLFWVTLLVSGGALLAQSVREEDTPRAKQWEAATAARAAGDYKRATALYEGLVEDPSGREYRDSLAALGYHGLGNVHYDLAEDSVAVIYYERAITLRDALFEEPHNDRAHSRLQAAASLRYAGRPNEAAVRIREALDIYEGVPAVDSLNWLQALNEVVGQAMDRQDLVLAVSASYRAAALRDEMAAPDPYTAYLTSYRAALCLLRMQLAQEALTHAEHALTYARRGGDLDQLTTAYNLLAIVQRDAGDTLAGYRSLSEALRLAQTADAPVPALPDIYLNLAEYYGGEGAQPECLHYDKLARQAFAAEDNLDRYYSSDRTPGFLQHWGRNTEALAMVDERLTHLTGSPRPDSTTVSPATLVPVIDLLVVRARVHAGLGQPQDALADYDLVFQLQDRLRLGVSNPESRRHLSSNLRPLFDRALQLYYERYRNTGDTAALWKAFTLSERGRAYSLLATLQESKRRNNAEEAAVRARVAMLQRQVSLGATDKQTELAELRLRLDRTQATAPRLTVRPVASLATLGPLLETYGANLLEYYLGTEGSLLFLLTPEGNLSAYSLVIDGGLSERVTAWRESIAAASYRRKSLRPQPVQDSLDARYLALGSDLTETLLPAAVRQVLHRRPRLVVVPDGSLHYLPFAALPLGMVERPVRYRAVDYLQRRVELQYAYSADYLLEVSRPDTATYARDLLAFAPSFGKDSEPVAARGTLREELRLSPLAHNRDEVRQLQRLIPNARAYYDREASRERFVEGAGHSRILHLSSHGSVDPTDPNLSFVAFSQSGDSVDREELLYFNDLYYLPLHSELTVLSACETSLGKLAPGETTMSMASAFASAGARSTLTTLWQVDDGATKDAIVSFYRHLVGGKSRSSALAAAQRELLESDYAHPFYWAGLSLHGAGGPLAFVQPPAEDDDGTLPWWGFLIVAVLVVGLLGYFLQFLHQGLPVSPEEEGTE